MLRPATSSAHSPYVVPPQFQRSFLIPNVLRSPAPGTPHVLYRLNKSPLRILFAFSNFRLRTTSRTTQILPYPFSPLLLTPHCTTRGEGCLYIPILETVPVNRAPGCFQLSTFNSQPAHRACTGPPHPITAVHHNLYIRSSVTPLSPASNLTVAHTLLLRHTTISRRPPLRPGFMAAPRTAFRGPFPRSTATWRDVLKSDGSQDPSLRVAGELAHPLKGSSYDPTDR
jgi:hypothetical protein